MSRVTSGCTVSVQVHERVHASDGRTSLWLRMTFQGAKVNLDSLSLKLSLESRRKISECVLACAGVCKRWKSVVTDETLFTSPVGHWKMKVDPLSFVKRIMSKWLCDYVSRHLSWLKDDQVFHLLSSFQYDCQLSSRQESLHAFLKGWRFLKRESLLLLRFWLLLRISETRRVRGIYDCNFVGFLNYWVEFREYLQCEALPSVFLFRT